MKLSIRPVLPGAIILLLVSAVPAPAMMQGLPFNVNTDHIAHSDTLAWSLMGVLGVTLGMVTACGMGIYRQFRRSTPETELLEEIKRQARLPGPVVSRLPLPPVPEASWERPADWWKNQPQD